MKLFAKKSLGQYFLNSPSVLAKIIEAAQIRNGENVLEIGPGTGVLTTSLLKAGAKVTAVEKDDRALEPLRGRFAAEIENGTLKLLHGDILTMSKEEMGIKDSAYAIVANIPYYITGAILESFLEYAPRPDRMVLLVQKEVADRIVASDGKESVLSVSVKAFGRPRIIAKVPPGAFNPPPTVDSAILSIEAVSGDRFAEMSLNPAVFFRIVKAGFAHKRKLLKRNLEAAIPAEKIAEIWEKTGLDDKIRAEDLPLDSWFEICA